MKDPLKKIEAPQNLTALAYDRIKAYILREHFDENTRLTEERFCNQLGISKSPVREALNSLRSEGLIRIEACRGAYLRRFSVKELRDLYDLREALEVYATSVADLTPRLIADLHRSTRRTREFLRANDRLGYMEEDAAFHGLIATATGNAELCRVLVNIQSQLCPCRIKTFDLSSSTAPGAHQVILEALERNNRKEAQIAMRNHIALVRERLIAFMENRS
jgi:DNA-binding GntR family transcriptional regulator